MSRHDLSMEHIKILKMDNPNSTTKAPKPPPPEHLSIEMFKHLQKFNTSCDNIERGASYLLLKILRDVHQPDARKDRFKHLFYAQVAGSLQYDNQSIEDLAVRHQGIAKVLSTALVDHAVESPDDLENVIGSGLNRMLS